MTDTAGRSDVPSGLYVYKSDDIYHPHWVVLVVHRAGGENPVTIEMTAGQWNDLPPVQYVVRLQLSRQQPRRPSKTGNDQAAVLPIPRGHIEWKDGQNWVILTAHRAGTQEPVTVEITLGDWFALMPVQAAARYGLEQWQQKTMLKW